MTFTLERKLCIYLLLLCNSFVLNARDSLDIREEQTLLVELKNAESDSNRLHAYLDLVHLFRYKNADKVILYADRGLELARRMEDPKKESHLLWLQGSGYFMKSDLQKAIRAFENSIQLSKVYRDSTYAFGLNGLGNTYESLGKESEALVKYKQVMVLGDSLDLPIITTLGLGNMALLYLDNNEFDSAKYFLLEAIRIAEKHDIKKIKAYGYTDLASIYLAEENFDTALVYARKAIILSTKRTNMPYIASPAYEILSQILFQLSDYTTAQTAAVTAAKIAEESGNISAQAVALYSQMKIYHTLAEYEKSLNKGFQILELAKNHQILETELQAIELLGDIYYDKKEYKNAFKYQKLFNQRKSEIFQKKQLEIRETNELRLKLERETLANKHLNQQLSKGNTQIANNKLLALAMIIFAFALLMIVIGLYSKNFVGPNLQVNILPKSQVAIVHRFKKQLLVLIFILYPPIIIHLYIWASLEAALIHTCLYGILILARLILQRNNNFPLFWLSIFFYLSIAFLPLYIGPIDMAFSAIVAVFLSAYYQSRSSIQRTLNFILFPSSYAVYQYLAYLQPEPLTGDPFGYSLMVGLISISSILIVIIYINKGILDSRHALWNSNQFLRQITDLNPHVIFAKDKEGRFTVANKALSKALGKSHEELIGKQDNNLLKNLYTNDQFIEDDKAVLTEGKTIDRKEEVILDPNGKERYFQTIKKPIYNENWEITGMLGVSTDITQIKLAQKERLEREATLNAIISSIPDPIFVIDANMNPIILNKEFYNKADIGSISYKEKIMAFLKRTLPEEFSNKYKKVIQDVLKGQRYTGFDILKTPEGEVHYEISGTPVRDKNNNIVGAIMLALNVTEKNKQRELIDKQIKVLNQKNKELEKYIESNMSLENFAYLASHDLKAPLRTIISFSQLFERRVKSKINEEEKELLDFVIGASKNMERLINDLLEYSRVNTKKISFTTIEVKPLIKEILNELSLSIQEKKARFQLKNLPETVVADQTKVKRLLQNLFTNSLKFAKHDKAPRIMISATEETDRWVFLVKDNGIGIDEKYQNKIFMLFKRLHGDSEYDGTGIGLAMVKKIVEQHQGEIWVESAEGKGSKFYFSISKELVPNNVPAQVQ